MFSSVPSRTTAESFVYLPRKTNVGREQEGAMDDDMTACDACDAKTCNAMQ